MPQKTFIKLSFALSVGSALAIAVVPIRAFCAQGPIRPPVRSPGQSLRTVHAVVPLVSKRTLRMGSRQCQADSTKNINEAAQRKFDAANRKFDAVQKQARQLFKAHRFADAERTCFRALALSPAWNRGPMAPVTLQLLGDIYLAQRRYKDAIRTYDQARKHSHRLELELNIALSYLKLGDLTNAHKFYSESKVFSRGLPAEKRAAYFAQLPGTKSAKTMEASIYFARGCEKSSLARRDESVEDFKRALNLVPRSALIASKCAWNLGNLGRGKEATSYWARAAVFGSGEIAREGMRRLKNVLMPVQIQQALNAARKIQ